MKFQIGIIAGLVLFYWFIVGKLNPFWYNSVQGKYGPCNLLPYTGAAWLLIDIPVSASFPTTIMCVFRVPGMVYTQKKAPS